MLIANVVLITILLLLSKYALVPFLYNRQTYEHTILIEESLLTLILNCLILVYLIIINLGKL